MIPKTIHYCWFGKIRKPQEVEHFIKGWKEKFPDYTIKEWNETNFDYRRWKFCREAYAVGKYAFVADVCRFWALYTEGGIYLDTDIEVLGSFDSFLHHTSFIGEERARTIGTGCMGAEANTPWVGKFLHMYEKMEFINHKGRLLDYPNTMYLTDYFKKEQKSLLPKIYPINFFCAKDYETREVNVTPNTVCIHHYAATWFDRVTLRYRLRNLFCKFRASIQTY